MRMDGTALRDPADLPALVAGLGRDLEICVERGGELVCRQLTIE